MFLTIDKGFASQHNLAKLSFGIVIIHVAKNTMPFYKALSGQIRVAVKTVRPGEAVHVR